MSEIDDIIKIISDITGTDENVLRENQNKTDLWDSFNKVEIVFALEEKFKISIPQEKIAEMNTISAIKEVCCK